MFSIFVLLVSACGFMLKCIKNRCFVCTYGIILLPIWLVVLIFGFVGLAFAFASKDMINDACFDLKAETSTTLDIEGST